MRCSTRASRRRRSALPHGERGVGTVITGYFDEEKIIDLLHIPENQKVGRVIGLGYPDEEPAAPKRKSVEELLTIAIETARPKENPSGAFSYALPAFCKS